MKMKFREALKKITKKVLKKQRSKSHVLHPQDPLPLQNFSVNSVFAQPELPVLHAQDPPSVLRQFRENRVSAQQGRVLSTNQMTTSSANSGSFGHTNNAAPVRANIYQRNVSGQQGRSFLSTQTPNQRSSSCANSGSFGRTNNAAPVRSNVYQRNVSGQQGRSFLSTQTANQRSSANSGSSGRTNDAAQVRFHPYQRNVSGQQGRSFLSTQDCKPEKHYLCKFRLIWSY